MGPLGDAYTVPCSPGERESKREGLGLDIYQEHETLAFAPRTPYSISCGRLTGNHNSSVISYELTPGNPPCRNLLLLSPYIAPSHTYRPLGSINGKHRISNPRHSAVKHSTKRGMFRAMHLFTLIHENLRLLIVNRTAPPSFLLPSAPQ